MFYIVSSIQKQRKKQIHKGKTRYKTYYVYTNMSNLLSSPENNIYICQITQFIMLKANQVQWQCTIYHIVIFSR